MKTVLHIVGARPNFMKVAPIFQAIRERGALSQLLVHTGQHYDVKMSDVFFTDLGMPAPDVHLGVGSGSHAEQTAKVMVELEKVFSQKRPDLVSVVGDVNSTLAAALVASKMQIPLAHVEAGLRSNDRTMPEEVNRLVTDRLADLLLTPSPDADENLLVEGVDRARIHFVGNVMIDSLLASLPKAKALPTLLQLGLAPGGYAVCTLHRPANVDDPAVLGGLVEALGNVSRSLPVLFPVHPRTRKALEGPALSRKLAEFRDIRLVEPMGYLDFLSVTSQAKLILTDSGGLQEESTALGVPCLTLRENTERPVTVTVGTNLLVGTDPRAIQDAAADVLAGRAKKGRVPDLWDGRAAHRTAEVYERFLA
jgi:UDP-N-acetylglucosamine 2-epimerase (non-hydrolysing)